MRTLGIYVQVPFCQTRCTYCNFHTGVVATARFAPYVQAVCGEIRGYRELLRAAGISWGNGPSASPGVNECSLEARSKGVSRHGGQTSGEQDGAEFVVDTVYIGGGTPSLLDPALLKSLLDAIWETFEGADSHKCGSPSGLRASEPPPPKVGERPASPTCSGQTEGGTYKGIREELVEVTLEADPETVDAEKAAAWVRAGIHRVSFGVQSFVDKELVAAGRMHRREDIYRAVPILRAAGIRSISFDLLAGLPHQTPDSWRQSLEELMALAPEHVSVYLLEIDEGSRLGAELLGGGKKYSAGMVPSEDEMAEFYELAQERLEAAGYHHYEISNWAKPGFESKHNLKYWRRQPYLGFGAGAHSFSGTERWANAHDAAAYVAAIQGGRLPVEQLERLTAESALEEELFLGLRQLDGIDVGRIEKEYGISLSARFDPLASAGLVKTEGRTVRLAPEKLSVSNEVFVELMR
jgi:oxygen-independent coproporphyrinogen III oxidase